MKALAANLLLILGIKYEVVLILSMPRLRALVIVLYSHIQFCWYAYFCNISSKDFVEFSLNKSFT